MNHKVSTRWRVATTRTDDGQHVGFGVYDAQDGRTPQLVSIAEDRSRATHVAHAFEAFETHGLGRFTPHSLFIRRAERVRPQ